MKRGFHPYFSYLFVTVMSVAMLAMQATLPFKLKELGQTLGEVGFLFTWTSFWYVISGLSLGWVSHRVGPRRVILVTLSLCGLIAVAMPAVAKLWQLYALATAYSVSICLFWAATEHATPGLHRGFSIVQSTSLFCVAFSAGNGLGVMASLHLQKQALAIPFFVSAGLTLVTIAMAWVVVAPQPSGHRVEEGGSVTPQVQPVRLRRSLLAARMGLVGVYGAYALVTLLLPRYLVEQGFSKPVAGNLTSVTLLTMAVTFAAHGLWRGWTHKLAVVRLCPFVSAAGLLVVCATNIPWVIAVGAVIIGVSAGTGYTHNLYYSLEDPAKRARNAGIHEALVGTAYMAPPAVAGLSAQITNIPQSIFWAGAALATLIGIGQNLALVLHGRSARRQQE